MNHDYIVADCYTDEASIQATIAILVIKHGKLKHQIGLSTKPQNFARQVLHHAQKHKVSTIYACESLQAELDALPIPPDMEHIKLLEEIKQQVSVSGCTWHQLTQSRKGHQYKRKRKQKQNSHLWKKRAQGIRLAPRDFAFTLRYSLTSAEEHLENALRVHQHHFRSQPCIANKYFPDFLIGKLVVEVDGSIHDQAWCKRKDAKRTKELEALGYTVIRFHNQEIFSDVSSVLQRIDDARRELEHEWWAMRSLEDHRR